MDLVFLGIQGSGKGTQARMLAADYQYEVFEMGQAFRNLLKTTEPLADEVRDIINRGNLVDDERVMKVFTHTMENIEKNNMPKKMIYDGIPRRVGQKSSLAEWMKEKKRDFLVVNILISEEEALNRLVRRKLCTGCGKPFTMSDDTTECDKCGGTVEVREDESTESIKQRIADFKEFTLPVLEEYKKEEMLIEINGEQTPEEVYAELKNKLKKYLEK